MNWHLEKKIRLTIEMVPVPSTNKNLHCFLDPFSWGQIRETVHQRSQGRCEACGSRLNGNYNCHEVWGYMDSICVQKLIDFKALCVPCHEVKHINYFIGKGYHVLKHLAAINSLSLSEARKYYELHKKLREYRNEEEWIIDVGYLNKFREDY